MTKKEFYLKSIIAMAGNKNYVEVAPSKDDKSCICHTLQTEEIIMDAERLMTAAEKEWPDVFTEEPDCGDYTIEEHLHNINESLESIEQEMERQYDNEHMD